MLLSKVSYQWRDLIHGWAWLAPSGNWTPNPPCAQADVADRSIRTLQRVLFASLTYRLLFQWHVATYNLIVYQKNIWWSVWDHPGGMSRTHGCSYLLTCHTCCSTPKLYWQLNCFLIKWKLPCNRKKSITQCVFNHDEQLVQTSHTFSAQMSCFQQKVSLIQFDFPCRQLGLIANVKPVAKGGNPILPNHPLNLSPNPAVSSPINACWYRITTTHLKMPPSDFAMAKQFNR